MSIIPFIVYIIVCCVVVVINNHKLRNIPKDNVDEIRKTKIVFTAILIILCVAFSIWVYITANATLVSLNT
jgi:hypothetical protein